MTDLQRMDHKEILRTELQGLRAEHRDLDDAITALEQGRGDQLTLRRLKKKKLALRDRIAKIEDELLPDIIA